MSSSDSSSTEYVRTAEPHATEACAASAPAAIVASCLSWSVVLTFQRSRDIFLKSGGAFPKTMIAVRRMTTAVDWYFELKKQPS